MNSRLLLCTIIALGLTACVRTTPTATLTTTSVRSGAAPALSAKSSAPLTIASEASTTTDTRVVRLSGTAIAGVKLEAKTANVKNGFVVGSPLMITEAATGKLLKQGVTYFDGSFQLDMSAPPVTTPVVVSVDLVDAKDTERTLTLEAPLLLEKSLSKLPPVALDAGSTAMVRMFRRWAEDATAPGQPASMEFARYVKSTSADTTRSFGVLVAQDAAIPAATDIAALGKALEAYVERSSREKRKYSSKRP